MVQDYCDGKIDTSKFSEKQMEIYNDVRETEENFARLPTQWMCTSSCPCPIATAGGNGTGSNNITNAWYLKYNATSVDQYARAKFNRTVLLATTNSSLTPFTLANNTSQTSYENFWDCYKHLENLDEQMASTNPNYQKKVVQLSEGFENFARDVEAGLNCNGICFYGLFFYFQNVYVGPPTQNCVEGLKNAFKDKPIAIGILLLISFVLTVFAHITSWSVCEFCRCCKKKQNN